MNAREVARHLDQVHGYRIPDRSAAAVYAQHEEAHQPGKGANHTHDAPPKAAPPTVRGAKLTFRPL